MSNKLKVGDRVSFDTNKRSPFLQKLYGRRIYGTVRLVEYGRVGVEFDEWIGGHEFFAHDDVDCERGHGWYFFGDDFLDKIEDDGDDALVEIDPDILFY